MSKQEREEDQLFKKIVNKREKDCCFFDGSIVIVHTTT